MDTQEEFVTLNDLLSTAKNRCKTIPTEVVVGNIPPQKRGAEKGLILVPDTYKVPATPEPVPPVAKTFLVPPVEEQVKKCLYISTECGTPYIAERPRTPGDKVYQRPDKSGIKKIQSKIFTDTTVPEKDKTFFTKHAKGARKNAKFTKKNSAREFREHKSPPKMAEKPGNRSDSDTEDDSTGCTKLSKKFNLTNLGESKNAETIVSSDNEK
jgi:hypothetical protein